ncbi:MAG: hypothetical protein IMY76_06550 [Chloroflexi bacterium]|nr:hypothetical protein [Chloroflexota bacterium]
MNAKPDKLTGEFGLWLTRYLRYNNPYRRYSVFYDPGDDQKNGHESTVKGFCGERLTNADRLTDIDVIVVNEDNEIELLIEIEDIGISSKTLLGDIFATLLCDRFAVIKNGVHMYFDVLSTTQLIVAAVDNTHFAKRNHFEHGVVPKLQQTITFNISDIKFVFGDDARSSIENLKDKMMEIFPEEY